MHDAAKAVLDAARARGLKIATAESCTGGLVAGALTDIAGSSDVVDRGFVTYSNEAKQQMLGVPDATIENIGAVSRETAEAMARGALGHANADIVVAITGIAGPGGGRRTSPWASCILPPPRAAARCARRKALWRSRPGSGAAHVGAASAVDA